MSQSREDMTRARESTDPVELDRLSTIPFWKVRALVAKNQYTSIETLDKLAQDADQDILTCVARNPNTPIPVLIRLIDLGNILVSRIAKKNLASRDALSDLLDE